MTVAEAAKILSRLGAGLGGKARAQRLSPTRRKEIAALAAQARWKKHRERKTATAREAAATAGAS